MTKSKRRSFLGVAVLVMGFLGFPAMAQDTTLDIRVITWNVVGLDSNLVSAGPNVYLVGVEVCNTGSETATGVRADFIWDSNDPYINLQNGIDTVLIQDSFGVLDPNDPCDVAASTLDPNECFDLYFNIEITRDAAAYDNTRDYHIEIRADNLASDPNDPAYDGSDPNDPFYTTPANREIYVEHLVSQKRNKNVAITGPSSVWVGGIFKFTMQAETATNGYEQIEAHITFSNTVFQVISAETSYTVSGPGVSNPVDSVYNDACGWIADTSDPNYRSCLGTGKAGDTLNQDYYVKILSLPTGADPNDPNGVSLTLNGVVYDFSGSSYHYNNNFSSETFTFDVTPQPTSARVHDLEATRVGDRTAIRWETSGEANNLGFHVWRESGRGRKTRITPSIIAGSALLAGPGVELPGGGDYLWADDTFGAYAASYWIEAIDLNGNSEWFGPVRPIEVDRDFGDTAGPRVSPLLDRFATPVSRHSESSSLRFIGAENPGGTLRTNAAKTKSSQDLAGGGAVKLTVDQDGWTRVAGSDLLAAGLDAKNDARRLHLFVDGLEIPISIDDGGDGRLDDGDSLFFYGTALDTPATAGHVYWLISDPKPGARIDVSTLAGAPANTATSFPFTVVREDRFIFFAGLRNGDNESIFGSMVRTGWTPQPIEVDHLVADPGLMAELEVTLQGIGNDIRSTSDHRVEVAINGHSLGYSVFDGEELATKSFSFPADYLFDGTNTVTLRGTNSPADNSLVDTIRLTYPHAYATNNDWLQFSAAGASRVTVSGFSSPGVSFVDVTAPHSPIILKSTATENGGSWDASAATPAGGDRIVIAVENGAISPPVHVSANAPSSWNDRNNEADLVVIGHGSLLSEISPLVSRRQAQGWKVAVIDVEDVFDEYNFGAKDSAAIRSFLQDAQASWKTAPRFVLLLGDGSVDPRGYYGDHYGLPDLDFVPIHLVDTGFSKAPSDEWFVDFDGDALGEMAIGRFPARTPSEAAAMVTKSIGYETVANEDGWTRRALLLVDYNDPIPPFNQFTEVSDALAPLITGFDVEQIRAVEIGSSQVRERLVGAWNDGLGLVNFYGHGSTRAWSKSNLFTTGMAGGLTNDDRWPIVTAMTCLTSFFHDPFRQSLGEVLMTLPTGAVAVWGSSGMTFLDRQVPANHEFYRAFVGQGLTLGESVHQGKAATPSADVRNTWILFGDPTLKLR